MPLNFDASQAHMRARRRDVTFPLFVAAVYLISVITPEHALDGARHSICVFHNVTGLPCPGCGMTRAFLAIGHGNVISAWKLNALSLPFYLGGLLWLGNEVVALAGRRAVHLSQKTVNRASLTALVVISAYWVYRLATAWTAL